MGSKQMGIEVGEAEAELLAELGLTEQKTKVITKEKIIEIKVAPEPVTPAIQQVGKPAMDVGMGDSKTKARATKKKGVSPSETGEKMEFADGTTGMLMQPCPAEDFIIPKEGVNWKGADYCFKRVKLLVRKGRALKLLMTGPRGTGKTLAAEWIAKQLGKMWLKIECTADMTPTSLLGAPRIRTGEGGGDYWQHGPLYWCARHDAVLVLDEMTSMSEKAQIGFNPLLDSVKAGLTNIYTGERLTWNRPLIIATANEGYSGNRGVQEALRDRFRTVLCGYLSENDEVKLVSGREPDVCRNLIRQAVKTANAIRRAASGLNPDGKGARPGGAIMFDMSPRALLDWAESVAVGEDEHVAWGTAVLGRVGFNARSEEAMNVVRELSVSGGWKIGEKIQF